MDRTSIELSKPTRNGTGGLVVDGWLTRSGLLEYLNPDGTKRIEYRAIEDVSEPESVASLRMVPVTHEHPTELVNLESLKKLRIGQVGDSINIEPDDEHGIRLRACSVIEDENSIADILDKRVMQLSCGYTCDLDETPGETPNGERYDARQKNIRYNHLALVEKARAGNDFAVRVDSKKGEREMEKIIINGVSYEAPSQTCQAVMVALAAITAQRDDAMNSVAELKKRNDAADAMRDVKVAELEKQNAELVKAAEESKARFDSAVKARIQLERDVLKVVGPKSSINFDQSSDEDLVKAAIAKKLPSVKLDGKSADYMTAMFDLVKQMIADEELKAELAGNSDAEGEVVEGEPEATEEGEAVMDGCAEEDMKKDRADSAQKKTAGNLRKDSKSSGHVSSADAARQAMIQRSLNAYQAKA